jgi:cell division protein FtsB
MRDPEFQDHPDLPLQIKEEGGRPKSNLWQRLSRGMEVVIYLLLLLSVYKLFGPELDRQEELTAEINRLKQIEEVKKERVERLSQEHRLLKTDKDYLETVARDRLQLQRPGEYIFRIERE